MTKQEVDKAAWNMMLVDAIDKGFSGIATVPTENDSNPDSPFIGESPEECYQLLVKLRKDTKSEVDIERFVIMDERSTTDDTVLLVNTYLEEDLKTWGIETLRASIESSGLALVLYETGHSSVGEDADRAKDGVYRG
jgi:hypothetical protein